MRTLEQCARWLTPVSCAFVALAPSLGACRGSPTSGDAGPPITYLNDGGGPTGHHDAGMPHDAGMIVMVDAGPTALQISNLAPSRGPTAGGTPITISGSGFLSGLVPADSNAAAQVTTVTFGGNPALGLAVLSDSTLQLTSPVGLAGPADVVIQNPNGQYTCPRCFIFQSPIELDQVSPARGALAGGTPITVLGLGFDSHTILLVGGHAAIGTALVAATQLTAVTPAGASAGPVSVRAFNQNGAALLYGAFTYAVAPTVVALNPPFGSIAGGTPVTLLGSGFLGEAPSVTFGGAPAQVTVVDDATLALVSPPGTAGPTTVTVTDADGSAQLAGGFVYVDPAVTSFSLVAVVPPVGPASGSASVAVVGTGFPAAGFAIAFGDAGAGAVAIAGANLASVAVPAGAPGPVDVIADGGAVAFTLPAGFSYLPTRTVSGVTPPAGPSAGGTNVTLTGSGFLPGDQVFVGPLAAAQVMVSGPSAISAVTPPGSAGAADVRVVSADGGNPALLPAGFTYQDPLQLIQVAPASGSQAGGTYVQLLGTGFGLGDSALFGAGAAADLQLVDGYTLACLTPPGAPGAVDVSVNGPADAGGSTLAAGFSYFDPTNTSGGQNGGPLDGTLNVTVLSSSFASYGSPIAGANVRLGLDPETPFQGTTDTHGQITFSDPTLVKGQTVTAAFGGSATTVDDVTQQDLTLFLDVAVGGGGPPPNLCPCSQNGQPPNCPQNCGLPFCGLIGVCVQCLSDGDCLNPSNPGYDPKKPRCNPPGGIGGACVTCVSDGDCANDPSGNRACDDARGNQSTYTCVQCTGNNFCSGTDYCDTQNVMCVPTDLIAGTVYGFKLPPNVSLGPTQHVEAHVGLLQPSVYNFEPFNVDPPEYVVLQEGGAFGFQLDANAIDVSLYAKFGIADTAAGTFTPILLGVVRGVSVDPMHPATSVTILLDTHLDQVAPIQIQNQLSPPPQVFFFADGGLGSSGQPVSYDTFAYLDLGQDGILPLSDVTTTGQTASLGGLPPIQGNGLLFMTEAYQEPPPPQTFPDPSQRSPTSVFFRSVSTDFTGGVPIGPLLPFVIPIHPVSKGVLDGTFQWSFGGSTPTAAPPDLTRIDLVAVQIDGMGNQIFQSQLWEIVVPGSQTEVQIPPDLLAQVLAGVPQAIGETTYVFWQISTAHAPRFSYDFFSYTDLTQQAWTSFQTTQTLAAP